MAYTTYTKVQARLGDKTPDSVLVEEYIAEAKEWIDSLTNTTFEAGVASTRIFRAMSNMDSIIIDFATEITAVEYCVGIIAGEYQWQPFDINTYEIKPDNSTPKSRIHTKGLIRYPYYEGPYGLIRVTARWGYSNTAPLNIQRIALKYILETMKEDSIIPSRIKSEKLGDVSFTYETGANSQGKIPANPIEKLQNELMRYKDYGDTRI